MNRWHGPLTLDQHLWRLYERAFDAVAAERYYGAEFCANYARDTVAGERARITKAIHGA